MLKGKAVKLQAEAGNMKQINAQRQSREAPGRGRKYETDKCAKAKREAPGRGRKYETDKCSKAKREAPGRGRKYEIIIRSIF
ncbi:hypothetical protein PoB_004234700 [Plakobranchus ocellatus]|uniref:Uncharacterized protein n=1 Tax=Plakobranchus ocellatus TaxID=259542 RepID=A0AAV4B9P7_9GAST|nr:hypothetical protein PoB_004234700 [Plakobranchus ocellatus]